MNNANKCHKCKRFVLGTYCYSCKCEIQKFNPNDVFNNIFGNIFKDKEGENK
jgi:hypothetical protein